MANQWQYGVMACGVMAKIWRNVNVSAYLSAWHQLNSASMAAISVMRNGSIMQPMANQYINMAASEMAINVNRMAAMKSYQCNNVNEI